MGRNGPSRLRCTFAMMRRLGSIHADRYRADAWRAETERLLRLGWIERWEYTPTLVGLKVTNKGLAELRRRCSACFDLVPERPAMRSCAKRLGHWCQTVIDPHPEGII